MAEFISYVHHCNLNSVKTDHLLIFCRSLAQKEFLSKPKFSHHLLPEDCLSTPADVISLDMVTIQVSDLEVNVQTWVR